MEHLLKNLNMNKKEFTFRDPVIESVVNKFVARSDVGFKKYGVTLDEDPGNLNVWMTHLQEELMDAVLYLQKAKEVYSADIQEDLLSELEVVDEEVF